MTSRQLVAIAVLSVLVAVLSISTYAAIQNMQKCNGVETTTTRLLDVCSGERLVDFSGLKPLNTSLSKEDILTIYPLLEKWNVSPAEQKNRSCVLFGNEYRYFLNPFLFPDLKKSIWVYSNQKYSVLPEELLERMPCKDTFARFEDVFDVGRDRIACTRQGVYYGYITYTEPKVLPNGTVVIQMQSFTSNNQSFVNEFKLNKNSSGSWEITNVLLVRLVG